MARSPCYLHRRSVLHDSSSDNVRRDGDIRHAQQYKAVLKVPLIVVGQLSDETPLTVNITVNTDVSIGQSSDSDPIFGLSDETNFIGFQTVDINNYPNYAP